MVRKEVDRYKTARYHNEYGQRHREDGPAVEFTDGTKEWWLNDKLHREDGPAIDRPSGSKEWWQNNKRHREDGPAVEYYDGTRRWYINGKLHREYGPAVEYADGTKQWWFENKEYSQEEFEQLPHMKFVVQQLKEFDEIQKLKI